MKKNNFHKIISVLLLVTFLFVALTSVFLSLNLLNPDIKNDANTSPFSFTGIATQFSDNGFANTINLMLNEELGKPIINWWLFDFWLQSRLSTSVFHVSFYKYLLVFLTILLFLIITILWTHSKDGGKRVFL